MSPDGNIAYICNSLAWSSIGVAMTIVLHRNPGKVNRRAAMTEPTIFAKMRTNLATLAGVLLVVFALVSSVISVKTQMETQTLQRLTDSRAVCQAQVNEQFRLANEARSRIAEQDRQVIDDLVIQVVRAQTASTQAEGSRIFSQALSNYLRGRQQNDAERARNPLPAVTGQCDNSDGDGPSA